MSKVTISYTSFGLYIHWPFCIKKCPYCDFNSYEFKYEAEIWINALIKELQQSAAEFPNYIIKTIFFGGGTPSLIPPHYIKQLIETAKSLWPYKDNLEITLETNPSSVETHALEEFMKNGINRFSIGMQSLNDDHLKFLGRLHNATEARNIISHAAKICDNISGDFIYALPKDTLATWQRDLDNILELAEQINLKHLSLYQLTIEENTAFEQQVRTKLWSPMDDDLQSMLYRYTYNTLATTNWDFYEISNAGKKNIIEKNVSRETLNQYSKNIEVSPYRSQHNLIYWQYKAYLGIGPGAHSRMHNKIAIKNDIIDLEQESQKIKFHNIKNPYKWLEKITNYKKNDHTENFYETKLEYEILSQKIELQEKMLMGLRIKEGLKYPNIGNNEYINQNNFNLLLDHQFIEYENNIIRATLNGRLCLNAILRMLFE